MSWKRFNEQLREYFTFTRKERNGILILLFILAVMQGGIVYTHFLKSPDKPEEVEIIRKEVNRAAVFFAKSDSGRYENVKEAHVSYFDFDPNKISAAQWKELGINDKVIKSICNYLSKGGRFYRKEDVKKIYNLREDDFKKIEPYIKIDTVQSASLYNKPVAEEMRKHAIVELNTAGIDELMTLPFIGEKRAEQIIKYRNMLGGFYKAEQLHEVYSIPDSVYLVIEPYIEIKPELIRKININTDTIRHPYFKYQLSRIVLNYRSQHGNFKSVEDLKKVQLITDSVYQKIFPYLKAE